ncbi:MAG: hypothetical protein HYT89_07575 [Candidatus Omnitrophica bacterium]|nr:hypothetical protein [Candidatus Omnitrophota bacterium]
MKPLKTYLLCLLFLGGWAQNACGEARWEKTIEYRFADGVGIKVHFTDEILRKNGEGPLFAKNVLDAAVLAYQTIVQFEGFSSRGYSFAAPNTHYAHDPDKTLDIFLGTLEDNPYSAYGIGPLAFGDAPCFDTVPLSNHRFQAIILLPANYREFIRNWEKINPSPLGKRNIEVDLRGTLAHEMLHAVLFYYNKNLNKERHAVESGSVGEKTKVDWYVEGLARYFETFVGARHDFFSQGFKELLPDKVRFSRGGSNYFMRYPDQAFTELRYENALFWRFIDYRKGMKQIELASRRLRNGDADRGLEETLKTLTGMPVERLLEEFSASILFKDFGLKDSDVYLKEVARTRLIYEGEGFYLADGFGGRDFLGKTCRTDWIGEWGEERASLGNLPVAGDNTPEADVSAWATDYYVIEFPGRPGSLPRIGVSFVQGGRPLAAQLFLLSRGGAVIHKKISRIHVGQNRGWDLGGLAKEEGLRAEDIEKAYLLVTNTDSRTAASYEILSNS